MRQSQTNYRLASIFLDPGMAAAGESTALYHERWEIETAFDELKTYLRSAHIMLRSKTPIWYVRSFLASRWPTSPPFVHPAVYSPYSNETQHASSRESENSSRSRYEKIRINLIVQDSRKRF